MSDVGGRAGGRGGGQAGREDDVDTGGARAESSHPVTLERAVVSLLGRRVDNPEWGQSDTGQSEASNDPQ